MLSYIKQSSILILLYVFLSMPHASIAMWTPPEDSNYEELITDLSQKINDKSAEPEDYFQYASILYQGLNDDKDHCAARDYFLIAADTGHIESMYEFAHMCDHAEGGDQDLRMARHYYKKAADHDHYKATHNYACMCLDGDGGKKDYPEAFKYFKKSVEYTDDFNVSWYNYASMCNSSEYGLQNPEEALKYFKKTADLGHAGAMYNYAIMRFNSDLNPQHIEEAPNLVEARLYLSGAAARNHRNAAFALALMQFNGQGGPKDKDASRINFTKAHELGHPQAMPMFLQLNGLFVLPIDHNQIQ
ncbi:MAG: tetratricopeptide repeat protein [Alphaproteobacteria bacterium]|nr:tetratricopeptide repeat protein [Alphaproteobacteria bacterium]